MRSAKRKFVRTARRYRTIEIKACALHHRRRGPYPDDLQEALDRSHGL